MKKLLFAAITVFCSSVLIYAQPRPVDKGAPQVPANAPASYKARYEGGIFGNSGKETGTLKIDEANERVVFYRKDGTEMFSIPFSALLVVYPDSKEHVSTTGDVLSRVPLPGAAMAGLLSTSTKYLIIRYDDEDVNAEGNANFKFDNKDLLVTFINALGVKAKMKQKGDAYYKAKKPQF